MKILDIAKATIRYLHSSKNSQSSVVLCVLLISYFLVDALFFSGTIRQGSIVVDRTDNTLRFWFYTSMWIVALLFMITVIFKKPTTKKRKISKKKLRKMKADY